MRNSPPETVAGWKRTHRRSPYASPSSPGAARCSARQRLLVDLLDGILLGEELAQPGRMDRVEQGSSASDSQKVRKPAGSLVKSKPRNQIVPGVAKISLSSSRRSTKYAAPLALSSGVATISIGHAGLSSLRYLACHSSTSISFASQYVNGHSGRMPPSAGFGSVSRPGWALPSQRPCLGTRQCGRRYAPRAQTAARRCRKTERAEGQ